MDIDLPVRELYELGRDARESNNCAVEDPDRARMLATQVNAILAQMR